MHLLLGSLRKRDRLLCKIYHQYGLVYLFWSCQAFLPVPLPIVSCPLPIKNDLKQKNSLLNDSDSAWRVICMPHLSIPKMGNKQRRTGNVQIIGRPVFRISAYVILGP